MGEYSKGPNRFFQNPYVVWAILAVSVILTCTAYYIFHSFVEQRERERFEFRSSRIVKGIQDRLYIYQQKLESISGLFAIGVNVDRAVWKKYTEILDPARRWPGIQAIGYSKVVLPDELSTHIQSVRAEGFPDYKVWPEGKRDLYTSILYIEPFDERNRRAFGYDMASDSVRRTAMNRAMDSGSASTSGMVTLVQETKKDKQNGFLIYVPVYRKDAPIVTVPERRKALQGWVYAPFRIGDFLRGAMTDQDPEMEVEIFDGPTATETTLLYRSKTLSHSPEDLAEAFKTEKTLQLPGGSVWTARIYRYKDPNVMGKRTLSRVVLAAGICINLLLFYALYSIHSVQRHAEKLAQEMNKELRRKNSEVEMSRIELKREVKSRTEDLRHINSELEATVKHRTDELQKRVEELEHLNRLMIGREQKMIELKAELEALRSGKAP